MTNTEFKYWIYGFLTLTSDTMLNDRQIMIIKNHANLVKTVEALDADNARFISELEGLRLNMPVCIEQIKKLIEE